MPGNSNNEDNCRLRIDPVLVDKFRQLDGGIAEVGTKIIRDLGLRYSYDKKRGSLDLIGPDTEILSHAIETLRFWVEDDVFPDTGITCQIGYPNRRIVVWRFHGDYAKKFDHLFSADIAKLKHVISVNIKAVPNKRNPAYIELFCHFSVYHKIKDDVARISYELDRVFQDDFFIPNSDYLKARDFARSKHKDEKVLYALKEYPDNKIRVWLFARDHMDVIRARKEWITHVGIIARDNEFQETIKPDGSIRSASFYGHPPSALDSEGSRPPSRQLQTDVKYEPAKIKEIDNRATTFRKTMIKHKPKPNKNKKISPRGEPRYDNSNFPRPSDFVYPVNYLPEKSEDNIVVKEIHSSRNPFEDDVFVGGMDSDNVTENTALGSVARWVKNDDNQQSNINPNSNNRIYVHQHVSEGQPGFKQTYSTTEASIAHPETNLAVKERYNPTHQSKSLLTKDTDPNKTRNVGRRKKTLKTGEASNKKASKVKNSSLQKRPTLQAIKAAASIRYNINVHGLDIYMYKHDITKVVNVDAIVNVVASNLKNGGLVANTVFSEAGKQVTDELDIHLSLYGNAKTSDTVVTSAGRLPSLGIMHVVSPKWKEYTVWEECASDLHIAIYNALKTAETHKYRKIAIPTIGSEPFFGVPKDLVAEVYVKALVDYSMAMGPLYPVLEIHLVDTDPNMLKYIKDAYESWATAPGIENMNQYLKKDSQSVMKNQQDVTNRSESAVSLKTSPSHRSENMVTFNGQSYTRDGEQMWTFDVLKRLTVHVYTGSILKLQNIDAIVCAIDVNLKGSLAKHIQSLGGKRYTESLKKARSNRSLVEGEVLVCDAGDLGMRSVLHSVIAAPIRIANQKVISRLDSINTQVFYAANQNGIKSLAMPLIGTGRLRERFEVEQCSLQLIDNVIEMCLGMGRKLSLKELHLVNTNHIVTQFLTQALRTRAHTKLRVETEPHEPSRQDVLIKAEQIRKTPDLVRKLSAKSALSKQGDLKPVVTRQNDSKDANTDQVAISQDIEADSKPENALNDTVLTKVNTDGIKVLKDNDAVTNKSIDRKKVPYLSQKALQQHNRSVQDEWMHLMDGEVNNNTKSRNDQTKQLKTARTDQSNHQNKSQVIKKAQDYLEESKMAKEKRPVKKPNRRIIQRSSDFIMQRSKADSYKTLFDKKRKYSELSQREEMIKLRKSQSSDDIWKKANAEKLLESFENERSNIKNHRMVFDERQFHSNYERDYIHTNETLQNSTHRINDHDERGRRLFRNENDRNDRPNFKNKSERLVHSKSEPTDQYETPIQTKRKNERYLIDHEREDLYMMDMDFLAKERDRIAREKDNKLEEIPTNANHRQNHDTNNDIQTERRNSRLNEISDAPLNLSHIPRSMDNHYRGDDKNPPVEQHNLGEELNNEINERLLEIVEENEKPLNETTVENPYINDGNTDEKTKFNLRGVEETNVIDRKARTLEAMKTDPGRDRPRGGISNRNNTDTEYKTARKKSNSYVYKGKQSVTFSNIHQLKKQNQGNGRAEFIQTYTKTPRRSPDLDESRKIVEWKNETLMTRAALDRFAARKRNSVLKAPKADDVSIRDQLKLEIEIVDNETGNKAGLEEEKRKIKRFWEVVGKEGINEADMYGEDPVANDKTIVAKVTKERVMSAKTTASRHSKNSAVTHSVGNYNVTLAVAH